MQTFVSLLAIVSCAYAGTPINKFTVFGGGYHGEDYSDDTASSFHEDHCYTPDYHCSGLLEKPFMLVTKSPTVHNAFTSYFAEKGLHSLANFGEAASYLRTPGDKYGLFFAPSTFFNARFFTIPVTPNVFLPSTFKLADIAHFTQHYTKTMPILFFADAIDFETFNFSGLKEIAKFDVYSDIIKPSFLL